MHSCCNSAVGCKSLRQQWYHPCRTTCTRCCAAAHDLRWLGCDIDKGFARLQCIGDRIHGGKVPHLYFQINISDVHWALRVGGVKQIISYADSLD